MCVAYYVNLVTECKWENYCNIKKISLILSNYKKYSSRIDAYV